MKREHQGTLARPAKRQKSSEIPVESENAGESKYQSPSTDPNQTNYEFESPRTNPAPQLPNTSNRSPRDMDLTKGVNKNIRSSVGSNRSLNKKDRKKKSRRKQSKPRRFKPGVQALREIREYQKSVNNLIPKLPFSRVVREVLINNTTYGIQDMRISREALMALQEASEMYLVNFFEDSLRLCIHAKRVTLMPRDMQIITLLRNNWGIL